MRDKRYDWLYERQKQPVRQYILEKFAETLAEELLAWPPPDLEWESEPLRLRYQAGAAGRPRDEVLRFALGLSRLELARELEALEQALGGEAAARRLRSDAERAAAFLLERLVTERCLWLKEYADGARLTRADLVGALDLVERRLFRVTLS